VRVFSILGPPNSGKSTLVQALRTLDGPAATGSVSHAVSLSQFTYLGDSWGAIDIAGGPDHLADAGAALAVSDAAVLCVPPDPDAADLSAPYLRLIEESDTPCLLFINRMDKSTARVRDIAAALQSYSKHTIVLRQIPMRAQGKVVGAVDLVSERAWKYHEGQHSDLVEMPEQARPREQEARADLLESLSDYDDALLEQLIEDRRPATEEVFDLAMHVLQNNQIVPTFLGAASHGNGVTRLMKSLRHEVADVHAVRTRLTDDAQALAVGCLADYRRHLGKVVVLRALGKGVRPGGLLGGDTIGSLTAIDGKSPVAQMQPGQLALAVKSDHLAPGLIYTADTATPLPGWVKGRPTVHRHMVTPVHSRDDVRLSGALARLGEVDLGLNIEQDATTGKPIIATQGPLHFRQITGKLAEDFGIEITAAPVAPEYRETISKSVTHQHRHRKQSGGAGQFADVVIEIKPGARGSGFVFEDTIKGGAVPHNYIPSVSVGAQEALKDGPHGFGVVDIVVALRDGKHHSVDSSDHAFRAAAKACVRDALYEAGALMLQPIDRIDIHVPSVFSGSLVSTFSGLNGQILGFEADPSAKGWDVFSALLPAASVDELLRALGGATQGTAWAEVTFDHYEEVRKKEAEKISAEFRALSA
jgi:elongation factor G